MFATLFTPAFLVERRSRAYVRCTIMAYPLACDSWWSGDTTGTPLVFSREATAYLAASFHDVGAGTPNAIRTPVAIPAELVARIRERDEQAFETLVNLTYLPLVRFARGFVGSRDVAEDIVQDSLAELWERAEQWAPRGNPATYLFGTVRHRAIDLLRRRTSEAARYTRAVAESDLDTQRRTASPERDLDVAEDAARLAAQVRALDVLLATLSERQRTAYDLRYRQGLSVPDIAQILGITTKSGEQLISRLLRTIRAHLHADTLHHY